MIRFTFLLVLVVFFPSGNQNSKHELNLVESNTWFVAGSAKENQETINEIRKKTGIVHITAKDSPVGEIELNVTIIPSDSNDAIPVNLSRSTFVSITYRSSQLIKLQAREGNENGTGCMHGGSHPRVDLPASPEKYTTVKIPWTNFKKDGLPHGKLLNIHNLCKFNFVNYNPVAGSLLEIKSVIIKN